MKTQIFATFGPACGDRDTLKKMIEAGMTGMRLNLSHTTLPESADYIEAYKTVAEGARVAPQILIDMQGPEIRVGELREPVFLETGEAVCFVEKDAMEKNSIDNDVNIPVPPAVMEAASVGDEMLLDDGKLLVEVESVADGMVSAKVIHGGQLQGHKSIKIKNKNIKMPPLTQHDIENIKMAKAYGVTALMQPFVLSGEDLRYVRSILKEYGTEHIQIYAKIESRLGVENLENILPEADAIIIARGDLGNDMPLWELPRIQKQIEEACKKAGVPYVVVTQMLASMEENPVPTRAEVSDIFHAVFHGAYGIMITGESAIGKYPVEAVKYLANTAQEGERYAIH